MTFFLYHEPTEST